MHLLKGGGGAVESGHKLTQHATVEAFFYMMTPESQLFVGSGGWQGRAPAP